MQKTTLQEVGILLGLQLQLQKTTKDLVSVYSTLPDSPVKEFLNDAGANLAALQMICESHILAANADNKKPGPIECPFFG